MGHWSGGEVPMGRHTLEWREGGREGGRTREGREGGGEREGWESLRHF